MRHLVDENYAKYLLTTFRGSIFFKSSLILEHARGSKKSKQVSCRVKITR